MFSIARSLVRYPFYASVCKKQNSLQRCTALLHTSQAIRESAIPPLKSKQVMSLPINPLILQKIPALKGIPFSKLDVKKLDGWSNHNYRITLPNGFSQVLRIPKVGLEEQIDRQVETQNNQKMAQMGICPSFSYVDSESGIVMRSYVEGEVPCDEEGRVHSEAPQRIGTLLRKIHSCPPFFVNTVDNLAMMEHYLQGIQKSSKLPTFYEEMPKMVHRVKNAINYSSFTLVPCHNDPNPRNFVFNKDNVMLLDWEYAGNGDPAWDVAYFITHGNLNREEESTFLSAYHQRISSSHFSRRMAIYKPMTELILSLWIRLQIVKGYYPISAQDFEDYELMGVETARTMFSSPDFMESLLCLEASR